MAVVNLAVTFGRQIRLKCVRCKKFMLPATAIQCGCGAEYQQVEDTTYEVTR